MQVNRNLKVARASRGFSQYELAFKTGICQTMLSLFERGYYQPTQEQAQRIARALEVQVDQIFPAEERRG